jgi:hypothetical protein
MLTRRLLFLVFAFVAILMPIGPAVAGINAPVSCDQTDDPQCDLHTSAAGSPSATGGPTELTCYSPTGAVEPCYLNGLGWLGPGNCYYQTATPANAGQPIPPAKPGPPGAWYLRSCIRLRGMTSLIWILDTDTPGPAALARYAESFLVLPPAAIELSPPQTAMQLIGVPTWLWLTEASFTAQHASVSVPGTQVTARATPVTALWRTGDGATVTCHGRGTTWTANQIPTAASPTCGHTYTRSSAGQPGATFAVRVTVTWRITWTATGRAGGTLPDLVTTATVRIRVGQAQAVRIR